MKKHRRAKQTGSPLRKQRGGVGGEGSPTLDGNRAAPSESLPALQRVAEVKAEPKKNPPHLEEMKIVYLHDSNDVVHRVDVPVMKQLAPVKSGEEDYADATLGLMRLQHGKSKQRRVWRLFLWMLALAFLTVVGYFCFRLLADAPWDRLWEEWQSR